MALIGVRRALIKPKSAGLVILPTISFIGTNSPTLTSLSATVTGANIGTAAADRVVVVVVHSTGGFVSLSSVSIGGNGATTAASDFVNGSLTGIAYLPVASGTTANITVNLTGALSDGSHIFVDVYKLNGLSSSTPTGTGHNSSSSAASLTTGNFSTTSGGVAIIGSDQVGVGSTTDIITGTTGTVTADHANAALDGFSCTTTASAISLSTSASTNYTSTWNGSAQASSLAAAAWR